MDLSEHLILIRGGGDLGTGVIFRLHKVGFPLLVLELPQPLVVRRRVAVATAVLEGQIQVEDMTARLVADLSTARVAQQDGHIPVLIAPDFEPLAAALERPPFALIDARLAKHNIDTTLEQASLVVGLGPGFVAGEDCHAVIETKRGHTLGRVYWQGSALPNTGTPGIVAGKGAERVLRAPTDGPAYWDVQIGDRVTAGQMLGRVAETDVKAPFAGVVRGLIAPGTAVTRGLKIGDIDARARREACFTISDKALALGGGALEAVFTRLNQEC